ncbi:hypothetical protein C8R46DRAFT_1244731 [Mycena filopes]|nr:hypothetical protein C8R46DRAFT_1244731 [Mycena filopes]
MQGLVVYPREDFERKWMSATRDVRQEHILVALVKACCSGVRAPLGNLVTYNEERVYCAHELRLDYLCGDGNVLLDLIESVSHQDTTITPERLRYISHPFWDEMFVTRRGLDITDKEKLATAQVLLWRTRLICYVLQLTVGSFLGLDLEEKPMMSRSDKLLLAPGWVEAEAMMGLEQAFGRKAAKALLQESKRIMNALLPLRQHRCTYLSCTAVEPADGSARFAQCTACAVKAKRVFRYCSVECQRKDWNPRHKRMCGKPLDLKTLDAIHSSFTDVASAPIQATQYIGDPVGGFKRPAGLNGLIAWFNLHPDVAYRLTDVDNVEGDLRMPEPLIRHIFDLYRELVLTTGDICAVAILAHYMCWPTPAESRTRTTRAHIISQFARSFEVDEGVLREWVYMFYHLHQTDPRATPYLLRGMSDAAMG